MRSREIVAPRDWLGFHNLAGHIINQYFGKLTVLRGINRKLKLAVIDLEFSRNRLTFLFAGSKSLLQIYLGRVQSLDQRLLGYVLSVGSEGLVSGEAYQAVKPIIVTTTAVTIICLRVMLTSIST